MLTSCVIIPYMFKVEVNIDDNPSVTNIGNIVVNSDTPYAFEVMEGFSDNYSDKNMCSFDLNKNNCLTLREFLQGKSFYIESKAKAFLKYVADEELTDDVRFKIKLTDFRASKKPGKFGRIKTEWDLIHYLPHRYIDRSHPQTIDSFNMGDWAVIVGTIVNDLKYDYKRNFVKIVVKDVDGNRISATFFRQKWLPAKFKAGDEVVLYGNYSEYVNTRGGRYPQISNAEIDKIGTTKGDMPIIPIYPQKDGDKSWRIQSAVRKLLNKVAWIDDPVPEPILQKYGLISRNEAYRFIHFPSKMSEVYAARKRIAFDDFVRLQVFLLRRKENFKEKPSNPKLDITMVNSMVGSLPYMLTGAQQRTIDEVTSDLKESKPMLRLIQGDVGSGKTMIAYAAVLQTVGSRQQAVVVAPTDILTTQLYNNFLTTLEEAKIASVNASILTGKTKQSSKTSIIEGLKDSTVDVLFSTHSAFSDTVDFNNLGLVVIDEQHKFGVDQRNKLVKPTSTGFYPDVLTMSATPIPRTTAQVLYGDMDLSVIDELPAGRKPIITEWVSDKKEAWVHALQQVEQGHQVYIVAALVEESETLENIEDSESVFLDAEKFFAPHQVALIHGRMGKKEKTAAMEGFISGETKVLVSTSVIEVGVNVPNATTMIILNSNRFGIASLHQIRGRVGRGGAQSYCYLVGEATTLEATERLNAMVASNDGFYLADKDLEIRGEGKLFGLHQSGDNELFIANLREHKDILDIAKRVAKGASSSVLLNEEIDVIFAGENIKEG